MELKKYQRRVLDRIRDYAGLVDSTGTGPAAYDEYLERQGLHVGEEETRRYSSELGDVPKVCVKVPTGGGKTFIAANALKILDDNLPSVKTKAVVWLVPRNEILRQTIKQLRNPASALRLAIDRDFSHRVEILSKEEALTGRGLNVAAVADQLTIFVLSYDSFKNKEGRRAFQENSALVPLTNYQKASGQAYAVDGADNTALISALAGLNPIVVVDESHHAKSDLSVEMLRNLNPRFVLELTATPSTKSNVIARVTAFELKKEQMVKLPVIVYRREGKREVVQDAIMLQRRLELIADREQEMTGRYIRPIVLFQAERKGTDAAETYRRLRRKIVDAGIPAEQIAIRTGDVDELKDVDLMSEVCPIRFIITVEALSEGWDCPFAYVLATVANRQSRTNVEQIVGRVLRQPYAVKAESRALNISYVLTSSADFNSTIDQVVAGLNEAGFSKKDVIANNAPQGERPSSPSHMQGALEDLEQSGTADIEGHEHDDLDGLDFTDPLTGDSTDPGKPSDTADPTDSTQSRVDQMLKDSEAAEKNFEQRMDEGGDVLDADDSGLREDDMRYSIRDAVKASVKGRRLPRFMLKQDDSTGLFTDLDSPDELEPRNLLEDFHVGQCSVQNMRFDGGELFDARQIDVDSEFQVRATKISQRYVSMSRSLFEKDAPANKRKTIMRGLLDCMSLQSRNLYGEQGLRTVISHVLEDKDNDMLNSMFDRLGPCAKIITDELDRQADDYKRKTFDRLRSTGKIYLEENYSLPDSFVLRDPLESLPNTLYTAEENDMNGLERRMADMLANCDNILWWHRIKESRRGEFSINGFINHYPDFLAMTRTGRILAIETKGEMLKNDDSRDKLSLGNMWANAAGDGYRYFMVFENNPLDGPGSYALKEFERDILNHLA